MPSAGFFYGLIRNGSHAFLSDLYAMLLSVSYNRSTRWLIRGILLGWLLSKFLSYRLWLPERSFPLLPVADLFHSIPPIVQVILFGLSVATLLISLFMPHRKLLILLLLLEILSCLFDQNRWQPWEYFFLFTIAAAALLRDAHALRSAWITLLGGLYFFSGLYKINNGFIHDVWQQLILHRWLHIHTSNTWLLRAGYGIGCVEMLAGIALLLPGFRKQAALLLLFLHVVILWVLGPLGLNQNSVVWPWNALLIGLLYGLFLRPNGFVWQSPLRYAMGRWILLGWWVLPLLYPLGYWDRYGSGALYSGGVPQLYICTTQPISGTEHAHNKSIPGIGCTEPVSYYKWCMQELNVVPVEEPRTYRAAIQQLQKRYPQALRFYMVQHGYRPTVQEWK